MTKTSQYTPPKELDKFIDKLAESTTETQRPMLVFDMDGNFAIGYSLKPGNSLKLNPGDDPEAQNIPFGSNIQELLDKEIIEPGIFAQKNLDIRVPEEVVRLMNENVADDAHPHRKFDIVVLTSRSSEGLLTVLEESGVEHPEKLTLVADSGANIYVGGKRQDVRSLDAEEADFLKGMEKVKIDLEEKVDSIITENGFNPDNRPALFLEHKTIAKNIHWKHTIEHYGQARGSKLDMEITAAVQEAVQAYIVENSPKKDTKPIFKMLDGPNTVEVKVGSVNKGDGLRAIIEAAATENYKPSAILYSGDDVCKMSDGKPSPGTEHAAFVAAPQLQKEYRIPIYTAHTHHPVSNKLGDPNAVPNPDLAASLLGIKPDIVVPDPKANAELVVKITEASRERAAMAAQSDSGNGWRKAVANENGKQETKKSR